jgi:hypothetical protein
MVEGAKALRAVLMVVAFAEAAMGNFLSSLCMRELY